MSTDRKYTLRARAERQEETRRRIVEVTERLHREVGPAKTTIAEIARRAGVERLTVYRNFPTNSELFGACQALFLSGSPPPGIAADVESTLLGWYRWYRANQDMVRNVQRDRRSLSELDELLRSTSDAGLDRTAAALAGDDPRAEQLIRVALEFNTWDLLAGRGASDEEIARLFADAVRGS